MAQAPQLDLRQTQSLVMTPQLQQAIKLLQSNNVEVAAFVEAELERNPFLEIDDRGRSADEAPVPVVDSPLPDTLDAAPVGAVQGERAAPLDIADWSNVYDSGAVRGMGAGADDLDVDVAAAAPTLRETLLSQIRLAFPETGDRLIAGQLVALLDPAGRLPPGTAALAAALGTDPWRVESVRLKMQRFEPTGLFCRDLRECLAVQLDERGRLTPAMTVLLDNLPLLARRDYRALMAACRVDAAALATMVAELRRLDPKPGAAFDIAAAPSIVPDVLMRRSADGEWVLEMNPDSLPRVLVNRGFYARAVVGSRTKEDRTFLSERLQTATWLARSLEQRANTILKVAAEIVRRQEAFFRHGVEHMRPLVLREIAEAVSMHESTISRVTSGKHIATPRGTLELKFFFTTAIAGTAGESHSAEAIRHRIKAMVSEEGPAAILSDEAIVLKLRSEGVDLARRTVAKYRESMRIPGSAQRRRDKSGQSRAFMTTPC